MNARHPDYLVVGEQWSDLRPFREMPETDVVKDVRPGRPLHYFDGGEDLPELAQALARDICEFLAETGDTTRRVAVEYVNPSLTRALDARGLDVVDGVQVSEAARVIKNRGRGQLHQVVLRRGPVGHRQA